MSARVIKKCKNLKCRQTFGVIEDNLVKDKKGLFKARCPFCGFVNKLGIRETKRFVF